MGAGASPDGARTVSTVVAVETAAGSELDARGDSCVASPGDVSGAPRVGEDSADRVAVSGRTDRDGDATASARSTGGSAPSEPGAKDRAMLNQA
jgi:hypothetical protein